MARPPLPTSPTARLTALVDAMSSSRRDDLASDVAVTAGIFKNRGDLAFSRLLRGLALLLAGAGDQDLLAAAIALDEDERRDVRVAVRAADPAIACLQGFGFVLLDVLDYTAEAGGDLLALHDGDDAPPVSVATFVDADGLPVSHLTIVDTAARHGGEPG